MRDKKNNNVLELLSVYNKQENNGDYFAYDNSNNNSGDCCQTCSDCCGSGNVASDCCFDACCSYACCGC